MNSRGYTLLEVGLFLAITASLLLVALVGLGPRLTNVRFSTSMKGLQSNIAKQLSQSQQGNSTSTSTGSFQCNTQTVAQGLRVDTIGTDHPCVYVGKVALLTPSRVEYHTLVSSLNPMPSCSYDESSLNYIINCVQAKTLDSSQESVATYDYPSQLSLTNGRFGVGFVRSPDDNTLQRFVFTYASVSDGFKLKGLSYQTSVQKACYGMSGRKAALVLDNEYSEPQLLFNDVSC